ncbi:Fungal specific transcription factor domain-containing protein [Cladophialophora immunda]|nr:Fungal specific transcription factor domain-containing protein [Cladophialophora immunda]
MVDGVTIFGMMRSIDFPGLESSLDIFYPWHILPVCVNCNRTSRRCEYGAWVRFKPVAGGVDKHKTAATSTASPPQKSSLRAKVLLHDADRFQFQTNAASSHHLPSSSAPQATPSESESTDTPQTLLPSTATLCVTRRPGNDTDEVESHYGPGYRRLSTPSPVFPPLTASLDRPSPATGSPVLDEPPGTDNRALVTNIPIGMNTNNTSTRHDSPESAEQDASRSFGNVSAKTLLDHSPAIYASVTEILTREEEVPFVQEYLRYVGRWMENSDPLRHFTVRNVHELLDNSLCRACILALSARYKYSTESSCSSRLELQLYQNALQKLINSATVEQATCATLVSCILLAVYEMMTSKYSDWLRHLEGCAAILTSKGWNASTGGLVSSCFWSYAKVDIWAAFCNNTCTLMPPKVWFDDTKNLLSGVDVEFGQHATILLWVFARIVNFLSYADKQPVHETRAEWTELWDALEAWKDMGSNSTNPVMSLGAEAGAETRTGASPFPTVIYVNHTSVIAWTMYHTGIVLLLEMKEFCSLGLTREAVGDLIYSNARMACGIIASNLDPPCLVNSIQSLWICGRNMRAAAEKMKVLQLLTTVQRETGWKCGWRSQDLLRMWEVDL